MQPVQQSVQAARAIFHAQMRHLFLWAPVAFAIGIIAFFQLRFEPGFLLFGGVVCLALFTIAISWVFRNTLLRSSILLSLICIGFLCAVVRTHVVAGPVISKRMYIAVQGRIVGIDKSQSQKQRLTLDQLVIDGLSRARTPNRVRIALHGMAEGVDVKPGQVVLLTAHLSPPPGPAEPQGFDFQRFAWFKQLGAVGYTRSPVMHWQDATPNTFTLKTLQIRKLISAAIMARMPKRTGGTAVAITTGDRAFLDDEVVVALRKANLAHLLAISGLHMGLLTALVFGLTRFSLILIPKVSLYWPTKKIAAVCAIATGLIYLILSGASVATERAFIMVFCMFLAVLLSRQAITLRAVALAAFIVLGMRPEVILSPGFQMSFSATIALIVVFSSLSQLAIFPAAPKAVKYLASSVISAAVAGATTAPFAAAHFNMVPHYGIIANVLAVPAMALIVMPGAILATILAPIGGEWIGLWVMDLGLDFILNVAIWVSGFPTSVSHVAAPPPYTLGLIAMGGIFICFWAGRLRYSAVVLIIGAVAVWSATTRPDILISDDAKLVGVMQNDERVLNRSKGAGFAARVWLENDGSANTQQQAFGRLDPSIYVGKTEVITGDICAASVRVIEAWIKDPQCPVFDLNHLKSNGALAGYRQGAGYEWQTTRAFVGRRLWNDWRVRKRWGQ